MREKYDPRLLALIRAVHTSVFLVMLSAIGWLVVSGLIGRRDRTVAVAACAVAVEAGVFLANDHICPLTPLAEELGAARGSVTDIFLPAWLSERIPLMCALCACVTRIDRT